MTVRVDVDVDTKKLRRDMRVLGDTLKGAATKAVTAQSLATKEDFRLEVNAKLTGSYLYRSGNRRAANLVRSTVYRNEDQPTEGPAALVWSKFQYSGTTRPGGRVDVLRVHETGARILRRKGYLFIPWGRTPAARKRLREAGFPRDRVDFIPTKKGNLLVVPRGRRGRKVPYGVLVPGHKGVYIPPRLDFEPARRLAEQELPERLLREVNRAFSRALPG